MKHGRAWEGKARASYSQRTLRIMHHLRTSRVQGPTVWLEDWIGDARRLDSAIAIRAGHGIWDMLLDHNGTWVQGGPPPLVRKRETVLDKPSERGGEKREQQVTRTHVGRGTAAVAREEGSMPRPLPGTWRRDGNLRSSRIIRLWCWVRTSTIQRSLQQEEKRLTTTPADGSRLAGRVPRAGQPVSHAPCAMFCVAARHKLVHTYSPGRL